jgi:hypothetical protein
LADLAFASVARPPFLTAVVLAAGALIALACGLRHGRGALRREAPSLMLFAGAAVAYAFLERDRHAWWMGAVAAGSLYLATLQYATGRIVALLLLGCAVVLSVVRPGRLGWRRLCGLASLCLVVVLVWEAQERHGATHALLEVRGERACPSPSAARQSSASYGSIGSRRPMYDEAGARRTF